MSREGVDDEGLFQYLSAATMHPGNTPDVLGIGAVARRFLPRNAFTRETLHVKFPRMTWRPTGERHVPGGR